MADAALDAFMETAQRVVYCSLATVDPPTAAALASRTPLLWEREGDRIVGWVGSRPTQMRRAHVARNPFASCFYWDPAHDVAVAECSVRWIEEDDGRRDAWERLSAAPAPMGYDPAPIWPDGPTGEDSSRSASIRGECRQKAGRLWRRESRTSSGRPESPPSSGAHGLHEHFSVLS